MVEREPRADGHPDAGMLAAFEDRALSGDALRTVARHLATCDGCRAEVRALHRLARGPAWTRPAVWVPALAAAALALIVLMPSGTAPRAVDVHRDTPATSDTPLLVAPLAAVSQPVIFTWRAVAGADAYRLTVLDGDGRQVFQSVTADTVAALADDVEVTPDVAYYWKVEARMDFDRWIASALAEFQVPGAQR